MQRFVMTIGQVEVTHQALHAVVPVVTALKQVPVEAGIVIPLTPLSEFVAHEQQFFTRESPHPAVIGAQVGKFLPRIARHTIENRFLTVHHFVMRQRQNKVFGVVVEHAERQLIMMILTKNRIQLHVVESVVHPAEVPLVPETQAAHILGTRDACEIRRLFRHAHRPRHLFTENAVGVT